MNATVFTRQRLAADCTLALGIKVVSLPLGFLTAMVMARFWGAQSPGIYTLAVHLVTTLSQICRLGLDTGMVRFGAGLQAAGQGGDIACLFRRGFRLVLFLGVGAAVGLFLAKGWLVQAFHAQALPDFLTPMSLAVPLSVAAAFCGETLRSLGGARWVVTQQDFLTPVSLLVLVGFLAWYGQGVSIFLSALCLAYLMSGLLGLGFLTVILVSYLNKQPPSNNSPRLRELFRYSWPLYLGVLLMLAFNAVDILVLGFFAGPENAPYYEAAGRTSLLVGLPLMAVNAVIPPIFARMHQQGRFKDLESLAQASTRWMYYVSLPLAVFLAALAPDTLALFGLGFGEARWALQILVVAHLVNVACGSVSFLLAMTGCQCTLTTTLALCCGLGFPLMVIGTAILGIDGLALAKGFWLVAVNIYLSLGVWRCLGLKVFASGVGWAHASAAAGFALFWLVRPSLGPWGAGGVGAFVYKALMTRVLYQEFTEILFQARWEALG